MHAVHLRGKSMGVTAARYGDHGVCFLGWKVGQNWRLPDNKSPHLTSKKYKNLRKILSSLSPQNAASFLPLIPFWKKIFFKNTSLHHFKDVKKIKRSQYFKNQSSFDWQEQKWTDPKLAHDQTFVLVHSTVTIKSIEMETECTETW